MDNKLTGSFYTPQKLIEYMAKYISGRITPRSILEPSAGDGRFVPAISIFDCPITAVELYKEKADALHMHCGEKCEIICADFLSYALETEKKYDFIIGNPPYISKKSLPECQRDLSLMMRGLQRADKENILGEIQVDDSVIKLETVENYDISHFETTFDVALIDYQLSSSFTGILVSAWIALYLQIPRLTLTTASYPGNPAYFNGSILKNEITDSPEVVIQRILECVENYNAELWLAKQHQELVAEYQHMVLRLFILRIREKTMLI